MTIAEAKSAAQQQYKDLWGDDWVRAHTGAFYTESQLVSKGEILVYRIIVDNNTEVFSKPKSFEQFFEGLKKGLGTTEDFSAEPDHRTTFLIDLKSGKLEITEHF